MLYAIIEQGGKQYKVSEGEDLFVDRVSQEKGGSFVFDRVLLLRTDDRILVGTPYVEKCKVIGKISDNIQGKKIKISKFKAKVHYRRTIGFRPQYTKILIEKIILGDSDAIKEKLQTDSSSKKPRKIQKKKPA